MRIGVIVNPIAGMGGRVGLKGTDDNYERARELGARPRAPDRAVAALTALHDRAPDTDLSAAPGEMGAQAARTAGFEPTVVGDIDPTATEHPVSTTSADTRAAVTAMVEQAVDLILFVGGDGTAVDIGTTLDAHDAGIPMLGVPAGVKVYSSVFAVSPTAAGELAATFDRVEQREINDIDEAAYREGQVRSELQAVRPVPVGDQLQSSKQVGGGTVDAIAAGVATAVTSGHTYILGPGGTLAAIKQELGIDGSPLGVDVWRATDDGGELLIKDARETEILDALGTNNHIIVSPIGGQGFVFGRGNHQISPAVIRQSTVEIVASREKLNGIDVLRVDIDDPEVAEDLRGWHKVRIGRFERRMMKIE